MLESMRYVKRMVIPSGPVERYALPPAEILQPALWAVRGGERNDAKRPLAERVAIALVFLMAARIRSERWLRYPDG